MRRCFRHQEGPGFTLLEVLVAIGVLAILIVVLASIVDQTSRTWTYASQRMDEFRGARMAFESITRRLGQATLNTYWDYADVNGNSRTASNAATFLPDHYVRQSELRFICGRDLAGSAGSSPSRPTHSIFFQAPLGFALDAANFGGMENLLNTWGYFIEFDSEAKRPPFLDALPHPPPPRYRYRLMELMEPSESFSLYDLEAKAGGNSLYTGQEWFSLPLNLTDPAKRPVHVLAENIVALVLLPMLSSREDPTGTALAPEYGYDSTKTGENAKFVTRNQLPPTVRVTMVAVDEATFARLQGTNAAPPDLGLENRFKTAADLSVDLDALEKTLRDRKVNYRVFTTTVSLKGARWSRGQSQ